MFSERKTSRDTILLKELSEKIKDHDEKLAKLLKDMKNLDLNDIKDKIK